jgi:hypothetical protein
LIDWLCGCALWIETLSFPLFLPYCAHSASIVVAVAYRCGSTVEEGKLEEPSSLSLFLFSSSVHVAEYLYFLFPVLCFFPKIDYRCVRVYVSVADNTTSLSFFFGVCFDKRVFLLLLFVCSCVLKERLHDLEAPPFVVVKTHGSLSLARILPSFISEGACFFEFFFSTVDCRFEETRKLKLYSLLFICVSCGKSAF